MRSGVFRFLRNRLIAGLIILIPIVITVKTLWWLFTYLDELASPLAVRVIGRELPGIGFGTTFAVLLVTGILFAGGPFRRVLESLEDVLNYVPVVGSIYGTIKKVLEGIGSPQSRDALKRFVLANLRGRTTPGFLTGSFILDRNDGSSQTLCTVYIPTNHLYVGDVVILPAEDVIETTLSVEEGITLMLSAGASVPPRIGER